MTDSDRRTSPRGGAHAASRARNLEWFRRVDEPDRRVATLSNGLTAIAMTHGAAPVVSIRVYVRAGSAFEGDFSGAGVSHVIEHVVTGGGAGGRTEAEIWTISESIGGLTNAYTAQDHICYHVSAPREHTQTCIEMLADWTVRPDLSEAVFRREIGVVLRELERDRDDPAVQLDEMLYQTMYPRHPMRHPVIGYPDAIVRLKHSELVEFHRRTHAADNCVVVACGALDVDETMAWIGEAFSGFERRAAAPLASSDAPALGGPTRAVRAMDVASASLVMAWRTVREGHEDDAALDLLSVALTEGDSARLPRLLRWDRSLVFDVSGEHESTWHVPGMLQVSAQLPVKHLSAVEDLVVEMLARLDRDPISEVELSTARRLIAVGVEASRQTAEGRAAMAGEDYLAMGDPFYADHYLNLIHRATTDDLRRAAARYLRPEGLGVVAVVPRPRRGGRPRRPAATSRPAPPDCVSSTLSDGLTLLVRPMPESRFAAVFAGFEGGLRAESDDTSGLFNMMCEAMPRGAGDRNGDAIASFFSARGSALRTAAGLDGLAIESQVLAADLEPVVDVLGQVAAQPRFDEAEVEKVRLAIQDDIARIDEEWHAELGRFARSVFFHPGHPYRRTILGTPETVGRFSPADLRDGHERFVRDGRGVIVVAGPVDPVKIDALCRRSFSGVGRGRAEAMPRAVFMEEAESTPAAATRAAPPATCSESPGQPRMPGDRFFIKRASEDREMAALFVGFPAPPWRDNSDRAAMAVLGAILAGYALPGGRLFTALRSGAQDMVYEVSGSYLVGVLPGCFAVQAACRIEQIRPVHEIIRQEIDSVASGELRPGELDRGIAMVRAGELDALQTAADHARRAGQDELLSGRWDDTGRYLEKVGATTIEAIAQVGARYLHAATVAVVTPKPDRVHLGIEAESIFEGL